MRVLQSGLEVYSDVGEDRRDGEGSAVHAARFASKGLPEVRDNEGRSRVECSLPAVVVMRSHMN